VGEDVRARFERDTFRQDQRERWFRTHPAISAANPPMPSLSAERRPNHWFFDPSGCARDQLLECGIDERHIFSADLCTASHAQFCSYRRDGAGAGRMAAVIRAAPGKQ
jgi:copper oxidase (laccase) domain-containing protein